MKIRNENELIEKLKEDINKSNKKRIIILSGHFPLIYSEKEVIEAINKGGSFCLYTLELGCKIGGYAKSIGKEVKFVFIVDDHIYEELSGLSSYQRSKLRNNFYKIKSGKNPRLPKEYREIMDRYGFSEKEVIKHNHKKKGRENCIYFSEKILRASKRNVDNNCARAYLELLEDEKYFNKKNDYLIAFIPNSCERNICEFVLEKEIKGLSASHVFIESKAFFSKKEELYHFGKGVGYRKEVINKK